MGNIIMSQFMYGQTFFDCLLLSLTMFKGNFQKCCDNSQTKDDAILYSHFAPGAQVNKVNKSDCKFDT